ncbi:alpha/beta fold hydrolase [Haladaptatus cibarius]|uniref:alpha/beta fold hydrolase n=1 Tax=Haladaptatus cibarius TaxID=453847 RepID=UPI000678A73E|nr:alpha/beta hydrolase [Haladaptatus cibarius]
MQTVTSADGTSIAYEQYGDGSPLILLHGGGTRRYWKPIVPQFAHDYTVVVPDRRGRGDSDDATQRDSACLGSKPQQSTGYCLEREIEDVHAIIDAVDGDPILFGHSFGGLQAIETARTAPIEKLVAYEPSVLTGEYRDQANLVARMQSQLNDGRRRDAMKIHLREVIHGGKCENIDQWLQEWPAWPACVEHVENTVRMDRAVERYSLPATPDVDSPALMLTGTDGPAHLRDSVRVVNEALPNSRLVEFEGVSHFGPTEAPDRVTAAVRDFIDTEETRNRMA